MDYVVTAELEPPPEMAGLDELQREGVAALLDRQLGLVEGIPHAEGAGDLELHDYRITVHPGGANVLLALDAPSLVSAEHAAATVLNELIGEVEPLVGWRVAHSEVRITEDEFNQSLAAAEAIEAGEPDDAALEAAIDEVLGGASDEEDSLDTEHWAAKFGALSQRLRAFDAADFGGSELAAGAVMHAVRVVTDGIFYDELALAINNGTVAEAEGLLVLEQLPPCYDHRYDSWFARGLLLASAAVAARLAERGWVPPRTIAEALALRLFVNEARLTLDAAGLVDWEASEALFSTFSTLAFGDIRHEELYEVDLLLSEYGGEETDKIEAELSARHLAFDQWFQPRENSSGIHPYFLA